MMLTCFGKMFHCLPRSQTEQVNYSQRGLTRIRVYASTQTQCLTFFPLDFDVHGDASGWLSRRRLLVDSRLNNGEPRFNSSRLNIVGDGSVQIHGLTSALMLYISHESRAKVLSKKELYPVDY